MRAIVTKFLPATNTKGSRIKATAECIGSVTVGYDHSLSSEANHRMAMRTLIATYHFDLQSTANTIEKRSVDRWTQGRIKDGMYVFIPSFYNGIHVDFPAQTIDMPRAKP